MPELARHRRIWVYLPPTYEQNPEQRYPVLYMHDAQNLFDGTETGSENWHVDHALNRLYANTGWACIVVGIEHGETFRLAEYSVVPNPEYGGGEGGAYLSFLTGTLKPLVDATFRTLPDAANTAMIGSSMGGLISVYAALNYGDVFGKVAAFSPSLWWSNDVYRLATAVPYNFVHKLVLLGGQRESTSMLPDLLALYYTLVDNGYFEHKIHLDFYNDGTHAEWFWGREFERAVRWLFNEAMAPALEQPFAKVDAGKRKIRLLQPFLKADLLNGYGKVIYSLDGTSGNVPDSEPVIRLQPHWHGLFALRVLLPNQRIELQKISL
ncbi:alpha/beta hydrolase [Spirosoma gilvum]